MPKETKMTKCVFCGQNATTKNEKNQPVCKKHKGDTPKDVGCTECGLPMRIKEGRYGFFWGCEGYPQCQKTFKIEDLIEEE